MVLTFLFLGKFVATVAAEPCRRLPRLCSEGDERSRSEATRLSSLPPSSVKQVASLDCVPDRAPCSQRGRHWRRPWRGEVQGTAEVKQTLRLPCLAVVSWGRPGRGGRGAGERPAGVESLALWCSCVVRVLLPGEESEGLGGACVPPLGVARGPHGLRPALGPCQVQGGRAGAQCTVPAVLSLGSPPSQPQWLPCQAKAMGRSGLCCPRSAAPALHHGRPGLGSCQREPSACSAGGGVPGEGQPPSLLCPVHCRECLFLCVRPWAERRWGGLGCGAVVPVPHASSCPAGPAAGSLHPARWGNAGLHHGVFFFFSSFKKDLGVGDGHQNLEMSPVDLWVGTKPVCLEQWTQELY